jgi:hypothetical protein
MDQRRSGVSSVDLHEVVCGKLNHSASPWQQIETFFDESCPPVSNTLSIEKTANSWHLYLYLRLVAVSRVSELRLWLHPPDCHGCRRCADASSAKDSFRLRVTLLLTPDLLWSITFEWINILAQFKHQWDSRMGFLSEWTGDPALLTSGEEVTSAGVTQCHSHCRFCCDSPESPSLSSLSPKLFASPPTLSLQICEALVHLHTRTPKVLHRDIKGDNIMIDSSSCVKLIDFGLAVEFLASTGRSVLYTSNDCGTHLFMAPEVIEAADDGRFRFSEKSLMSGHSAVQCTRWWLVQLRTRTWRTCWVSWRESPVTEHQTCQSVAQQIWKNFTDSVWHAVAVTDSQHRSWWNTNSFTRDSQVIGESNTWWNCELRSVNSQVFTSLSSSFDIHFIWLCHCLHCWVS